jgi:putative heme-binding domain-containing protein
MFRRPELSFRLFEACLAASNTLAGKSSAGIADDKILLERVTDDKSPAAIRAYALRLLPASHKKLTVGMLKSLMAAGDDTLTAEVVRTLAARAGEKAAADELIAIAHDDRLPPGVRADAIAGLAANGAAATGALWPLAESEQRPVREEALRALRFASPDSAQKAKLEHLAKEFPESADLVDAILDPGSVAAGWPDPADTGAWQKRLDAVAGDSDLESGRRLFHHPVLARCATCHRHSGRGVVLGPELTTVADRDDSHWLLESILEPHREVAPQYYPRSLKLADGSVFTGFLLRAGGRSGKEFYRDITGADRAIVKTEIVGREELRTSLMLPGLLQNLTPREARDLLAFLQAR